MTCFSADYSLLRKTHHGQTSVGGRGTAFAIAVIARMGKSARETAMVNKFIENGHAEMRKNHEVPAVPKK